uniref:Peptidase S1 domain-containing protein n=1 Tax=Loxodonta africana TaxID=9785 RepID=G3U1T9_LOXAF
MLLLLILLASPLPSRAFIAVIPGGIEARPHSWPYMAETKMRTDKNTQKSCGGFLVREDFVLTVAHCFERKMVVILGAHNFTRNEPTMQTILVIQAVPHPEYDPDSVFSDIMVLKNLRNLLSSSLSVLLVQESRDWVKPGQVCSAAGWGKTENDKFPNILQEVELEMQDKKMSYDDTTQICVGNSLYLKNAEMGDSGALLVCNNVVQGIVSNRFKNCSPGVFTRIPSFVPWIHRIM